MPKGITAESEVTLRGFAEEFAAYIIAGGRVFHAYCHSCKSSGIYYGKTETPDGFLTCTCGKAGLDLCPMGSEIMRSKSLHMPDGERVKKLALRQS